jgi:hypothetical protein
VGDVCQDSDGDTLFDAEDLCPYTPGDVITWSGCPVIVDAPVQTAPPDGSVFDFYPRTTTLEWDAVPEATAYEIEIEYCGSTCADWSEPYPVVTVVDTSYTFNFIGAQPGRWRVRAINPGGEGPVSGWWGFDYMR